MCSGFVGVVDERSLYLGDINSPFLCVVCGDGGSG